MDAMKNSQKAFAALMDDAPDEDGEDEDGKQEGGQPQCSEIPTCIICQEDAEEEDDEFYEDCLNYLCLTQVASSDPPSVGLHVNTDTETEATGAVSKRMHLCYSMCGHTMHLGCWRTFMQAEGVKHGHQSNLFLEGRGDIVCQAYDNIVYCCMVK